MPKTVLVAALNWGIGHATRDIPIINRLLKRGANVILASDGAAKNVWQREFPDLQVLELPSWNIKYQKRGSFIFKMATRVPYILKAVANERRIVRNFVKEHNIDAIISDNRFGVWHPNVYNVFITHQIDMRMGPYLYWAEPFLYMYNKSQIKKYQALWVPDYEGKRNLAGALAHKHKPIDNITFLGPVSRFMDVWDGQFPLPEYDICAVLSGVEPQRTLFEEKLINQLKSMTDLKVVLVQGISGKDEFYEVRPGFQVRSFMQTDELMNLFLKSKCIICRSGYSTVLDLAVLQQKALMVATPGQTEQVYLGKWLEKRGFIVSANQKKLDVKAELARLENVEGFNRQTHASALDNAVDALLGNC